MATKDKPSGLLSRMAQLIRPSSKDGRVDDGESELEQDSELAKQALKDRIQQKRADDSVRRREFNHLRKLRNASPLAGSYVVGGRPSIFQNSASFEENGRALTLKKIDDIEAHMSQNWTDHKTGKPAADPRRPVAKPAVKAKTKPLSAASDSPLSHQPTERADLLNDEEADYDFTKVNLAPVAVAAAVAASASTQTVEQESFKNSVSDSRMSGFSNSKLVSVEMVDSLGDAHLQDAAIRFADGDDAGAEAVLLSVLHAPEERPGAADACAAGLFDMFRGTGQKARFEAVALEYAQRFGRSPPEWFSTSELLDESARAEAAAYANGLLSAPKSGLDVWDCPADLTGAALQSLQGTLKHAPQPWHLNWAHCQSIAPDAAQSLAELFSAWCNQPVKLRFDAADVLKNALRNMTPRGDTRVDPLWWHLRLDALRILHLQDDFEDAALEFCVVYELSPPSWVDAQCHLEDSPADSATAGPASVFANSNLGPLLAPAEPLVQLAGVLQGDAIEALHKLPSSVKRSERLTVSCKRLIRVDFAAAGSILNWAAQRESEGCRVQFVDVPRLVAAFFAMIGINEHAQVMVHTK